MGITSTEFVVLRTFDNPIQAYMCKAILGDCRINSFIFDENIIVLNPLLSQAVGGIKLVVYSNNFDLANSIIENIDKKPFTNELLEVIKCSKCQSQDIFNGFKSFKGFKGILSALVSFIFVAYPIYFQRVYRCKKCGFEFN